MKNYFAVLTTVSILSIGSLVWAAPTITINLTAGTNATSHRIEKKIGAGSYSTLTTLTMPTTSYVDTAVAVGNIYYYRAVSINSFGESAASLECNQSLVLPGPPTLSCSVQP